MNADIATYLHDLSRALRVVVTGGRDYADEERVRLALGWLNDRYVIQRLAHGGATGADALASSVARCMSIHVVEYAVTPAEWKRLGKRAGPLRNRRMLDEERPDLVVAFPGNTGTADCCRQAGGLGIRIWEVGR